MGITVKEAVSRYDVNIFQLGFIRFFCAGILVLPAAAAAGKPLAIVSKKYFLLRGIFGAAGNFIFFVMIAVAGLGRGTVLMQLTGVFGAAAAVFLLKEKINQFLIMAIVSAGTGILFCSGFDIASGVELLAIAGAACSGLALVFTRKMNETDSLHTIFFSQCVCGTLLTAGALFFTGFPVAASTYVMGTALTVFDTIGQYLMTMALKRVSVSITGPLLMTSPVISLSAGMCFFSESLDFFQWIGSILILTGSFLVVLFRQNGSKNQTAVIK